MTIKIHVTTIFCHFLITMVNSPNPHVELVNGNALHPHEDLINPHCLRAAGATREELLAKDEKCAVFELVLGGISRGFLF